MSFPRRSTSRWRGASAGNCCRPCRLRSGAGGEGGPMEGHSQDRPHAPGRCHAAFARSGVRRLRPAIGPFRGPGRFGVGGGAGIARRRHGGGHRAEHPSGVRPPRLPSDRPVHGHRLPRGRRSFRGQRPARRAGRVSRATADRRRNALQRGQQHPLARFRAAVRNSRNHASPISSRAARSCRARSTR